MNLYRVWAYRAGSRSIDEQYYIVLAPDKDMAKDLASKEPRDHDDVSFRVAGEIHGDFAGSAQVLGHCESGTWIWLGP
jgi:hypothetical protein